MSSFRGASGALSHAARVQHEQTPQKVASAPAVAAAEDHDEEEEDEDDAYESDSMSASDDDIGHGPTIGGGMVLPTEEDDAGSDGGDGSSGGGSGRMVSFADAGGDLQVAYARSSPSPDAPLHSPPPLGVGVVSSGPGEGLAYTTTTTTTTATASIGSFAKQPHQQQLFVDAGAITAPSTPMAAVSSSRGGAGQVQGGSVTVVQQHSSSSLLRSPATNATVAAGSSSLASTGLNLRASYGAAGSMLTPPHATQYARYHYDLSSARTPSMGGGFRFDGPGGATGTPVDKTLLSPNDSLSSERRGSPMHMPASSSSASMHHIHRSGMSNSFPYAAALPSGNSRLSPRISSSSSSSGVLLVAPHPADGSNFDRVTGLSLLPSPSRHPRLLALDALRGFMLVLMILVSVHDGAGRAWSHALDGEPWDGGVRLADFVWPAFLFIMGVAIPLSGSVRRPRNNNGDHSTSSSLRSTLRRSRRRGGSWWSGGSCFRSPRLRSSLHVLLRSALLFLVGFMIDGSLTGFPSDFNLARMRVPGVLQRLAFGYLLAALAHLWLPVRVLDAEREADALGLFAAEGGGGGGGGGSSISGGGGSFGHGIGGGGGGGSGGSNASSPPARLSPFPPGIGLITSSTTTTGSSTSSTTAGSSSTSSAAAIAAAAEPLLYLDALEASTNRRSTKTGKGRGSRARPSVLFVTRCFLLRKYIALAILFALVLTAYLLASLLRQPEGECYHRGDSVFPSCNAARQWDLDILGAAHMLPTRLSPLARSEACSSCSPGFCPRPEGVVPRWCTSPEQPFDPAGVVPSIGAALLTLAGLVYGQVLVHEQRHRGRVLAWVVPSVVLVLLGTLLHVTSEEGSLRRFNPSVASPPFVALMIGCNGLLLAGFYALVEWGGNNGGKSSSGSRTSSASRAKRLLRPLICLGMNSLLVYILSTSGARLDRFARFVYWGNDAANNNVVDWFVSKVLKHTLEFGDSGAQLTYAIIKIGFWSIVATLLAKRAYFWKL